MSTPNQPRYTSADIDRYLNGQMSAEESYALEQAAWQDPLLEAAIEGFLAAKEQGISTASHVQSLEERIQLASYQRSATTSSAPVVPMRRFAAWKSLAAAVLAISALSLGLWMMFKPAQELPLPVATTPTDTPQKVVIAQEPIQPITVPTPPANAQTRTVKPNPKTSVPSPITQADAEVPLPITETPTNAYKPAPAIAAETPKPTQPAVEPQEDRKGVESQELAMVEIAANNQAPRNLNSNDQRGKTTEAIRQAYQSNASNKKLAKAEAETDNTNRQPTRRFVTVGLAPVNGWEGLEQAIAESLLQDPDCASLRGQLITVVLLENKKEMANSQWRVQAKRISAACEGKLLQLLREQTWEYSGKSANPEIQWVF